MRFSLAFSSSSIFKRLSSVTPKSPNFFFHVYYVASDTPVWRHTSTTGVPDSANRSAYAICSSLNLDLFIASPCAPLGLPESNRTSGFEKSRIRGRRQAKSSASICSPSRVDPDRSENNTVRY